MGVNRDFLFRIFFKLRVHESHGDAFQQFFSNVMTYSDPRFQSILPWGSWGDGGNDGWIEEDLHYFQVYAPKPTTKDSETGALTKAIGDFDKLKKWGEVRSYSYVYNDRFTGTPAPISLALKGLKKEKDLEHAGPVSMLSLLQRFMNLAEDQRLDLLGTPLPTEDVELADAAALGELLSSLTTFTAARPYFLNETAPDFDEKIEFNGLSPRVARRLEASSYQVSVVDDFLDTIEIGTKQALAQQIREYYQESKVAVPDGEDAPDERYFWLVDRIVAPSLPPVQLTAFRTAAEMILAKYFETCDAYEHPDSNSAA